ncbi:hypothetical protein [Candidatus Protochlamydia amoebophila]|uniref:Uncharacterized protein n=1 Tax=Candidatus Protochlamydia amoebophila TaxID=362787 RepID=A0A0C1JYV9_9BACT|nr:hypothetical protein [Candidatus Protochlamydia amoebophila]KIC72387.1 hypothetical protein DB44_CJ00010 [Candidatus Protochlamydia amoebophila]
MQFLPDNLRIAYFTNDINCDFSFRIRDKDCKLKFCEWLSGPTFQRFISNNQFLFRLHANQISIIPLKAFVGKKEFPLSIRNMYFSQDEQTIKLWSFEDKLFYFADGQAGYLDIENKLYTYQTSNGKNLGHKNLCKPFFETTTYSTLSPDAQYRIRARLHKNSSKNKIIVSQLENGRVLGSYVGSFLSWSLLGDNRYLLFIYQRQFKLIEIDFKQQNQLVNMDAINLKAAVACPHSIDIEKNKYIFSDHIFPITTFALINGETGQIRIRKINWKTQRIKKIAKFSTKLSSDNFRFLQPNYYFQQSKFYFQKDENTLIIWDIERRKERRNKENIKFENRLEKFVLSKDGSCMVTIENIVNSSQIGGIQTNFCLWNLGQKKKIDQFIAPFHNSVIQLSPRGKFLIVQDIYSFVKLRVWKIKKGKFHFLWKFPIYLNVTGLSLKNTQNLDAKNTLMLTQLQNEKRFQ